MILLLALLAVAGQHGSTIYAGPPPARYQHGGHMVARLVTQSRINRVCGTMPGWDTDACVDDADGSVYLPNPCRREFRHEAFAQDVCHELGHVNGWPGDHPR